MKKRLASTLMLVTFALAGCTTTGGGIALMLVLVLVMLSAPLTKLV